MKKQRKKLPVAALLLNEGQLGWLPRNPREWTDGDVKRTVASIREDTDFLEDRPILVVPFEGRYVAYGGNLRLTAAREMGLSEVPCMVYTLENEDADRETIKRRAMKDNGSFGSWDYDILANEWDDCPLVEWGVPAWEVNHSSDLDLSTKGKEKDAEYQEFEDKFKPKLTTDDCYTPPAVYDAILKFVGTIIDLKGKKIERPFVPGGDYENYPYQKNSVVVDNPPFSLSTKVYRFLDERNIPFFLFAPQLTLFNGTDRDLTYIISNSQIEYENGARVLTGFVTNMIPDLRIWCCPELKDMIEEAQPDENKTRQGFIFPDNIVTSAILGKIAKRGIELKIRKVACIAIKQSDSAEEQGRALYGWGYLISDRAAAERAAAEKAAAERAAATRLNLSERERKMIEQLNEQDK